MSWFFYACLVLLSGCTRDQTQLERIVSRGYLRVAMVATPPLYFPGRSFIQGYGYDLVQHYAATLGLELELLHADTLADIVTLLRQGKAHIGITESAPVYLSDDINVQEIGHEKQWHVIGHQQNSLPNSIDDISADAIVVAKGSRAALVLAKLKTTQPGLYWQELVDADLKWILAQIHQNDFSLSIIDADVYAYYRYLYPKLKIAFSFEQQYPPYWLTNANKDDSLRESFNAFITQYKNNGQWAAQYHAYLEHVKTFNYVDSLYYLRRIQTRLPKYMPLFKEAARGSDFDAQLLAAVSYQESHWNEKAKSHTGVRGLMMLTLATAKRLDVTDRLDPRQSIQGGARYLNILEASIPDRIKMPDRLWMTLAAYNIGLGHLEDARILTQLSGEDPDIWNDVKHHLPKLSQRKWYKMVEHGYARGHEPVQFVQKIRLYYDILRLYQADVPSKQKDQLFELDQRLLMPLNI